MASLQRRFKRQQERERKKMIEKIHRETMARFKNMTEEEIKQEIEMFQQSMNNQMEPVQTFKPIEL